MLLSFRVANYRSLRADQTLTFVASDVDDQVVRPTGLREEGRDLGVVPSVGVFGANASGKSNLLSAIRAMREAIRDSVAEWARAEGVPREPFALDPVCRDQTTLFEVSMLLGRSGIRHTYGFELSDTRVEAEWLHAYPHGRRQVWFDREADREDGGEEFRFPGEGLKDGKRELRELAGLTRSNALFLTVGASFNRPQLARVHRWFMDNFRLAMPEGGPVRRGAYTRYLLVRSKRTDIRERVESLLRVADLGIVGLDVDDSLPVDQQVRLLHRGAGGESVPLDFTTQESLGTHAWFAFLGSMLRVLESGSVLLADELDSSLHPLLAAEVVRLFQDPEANPHGAQLIFTTHDATLLGSGMISRPLSRDQVWITSKLKTGETELYPLTDARPRKEENLERGYLHGRYGGVPRVSAGELARVVAEVLASQE